METHHDDQVSIIGDFDIDVLAKSSTALSIVKLNWSNYKQRSGEMALRLERK